MVKRSFTEKRKFVRAKRLLGIQFQLVKTKRKEADCQSYLSTTHDMSAGGLTFYSPCEYMAGDILQVSISMGGLLDIYEGKVRVVRKKWKKNARHYFIAVKYLSDSG